MDKIEKNISTPPPFCQYSSGPCDQNFSETPLKGSFFIYPSEPSLISSSIDLAIEELRKAQSSRPWTSWRDLPIEGRIIFCEICKAARFSSLIIADVTTLNLNVLFEIGYCIGLGLPVVPIRDTTYKRDKKVFDEFGILDTLGYMDFHNANEIAEGTNKHLKSKIRILTDHEINRSQPLYLVKSPIDTDGSIKLLSCLKKSGFNFRTFDPRETVRLSLYEAEKQTSTSLGVITYLLNPEREGAIVHNARCAFVAGLAMAHGKRVLMLQEGEMSHPIDYRDIVQPYKNIEQIPRIVAPLFKGIITIFQELSPVTKKVPLKQLEQVNLGDLAAENEIQFLPNYFVPTGQYHEARHGHARLVIGRKGSGKTAIFYKIRDDYVNRKTYLVLDLKPEGHQFTKLRESVLRKLSPGLQEHTMTAFWTYLILEEIAHKIIQDEVHLAYRDPNYRERYEQVKLVYGEDTTFEQGDFSERLLSLVDSITERQKDVGCIRGTPEVTELVYRKDIRNLQSVLNNYLALKDGVWILIDNLDKGWPVRGATNEDIMILRCLLDATRKIQRQCERNKIEFKIIIFIRNDIYEHLLSEIPDKGKDTVISLDWNDPEIFREIIKLRLKSGTGVGGSFEDVWRVFFDSHINAEDSFGYMLSRTLMKPREIIRFARQALEVAINRNHEKVLEEDIVFAEIGYSEDSLQDLMFELKDINPKYQDVLYNFFYCKPRLNYSDVESLIKKDVVEDSEVQKIIELLVWFGFLGVIIGSEETKYSYQVQYNIRKLGLENQSAFEIHPCFRCGLECKE